MPDITHTPGPWYTVGAANIHDQGIQWNAEEDDILSSGILDEFTIVPGDFTYEIELRYMEAV